MQMVTKKNIEEFLINNEIAVCGASLNKKKFGNIIFRFLKTRGYHAYPINPALEKIEGEKCYPDISSLPETVKAAVMVTRPEVTEEIVESICKYKVITNVWFQKGSESKAAILAAKRAGLNVIEGHCILMFAPQSGFPHSVHRFIKKSFGSLPK